MIGIFFEQAIEQFKKDLSPFYDLTTNKPNNEIIIIIDGTDEYINPKVDLDDFVLSEINKLAIKKKVIGLRRHKSNDNAKTLVKNKSIPFIDNPDFIIELVKLKVASSKFPAFLKAFAEIESNSIKNEAPCTLR